MKILVFADSHRYTLDMYELIEDQRPDAVIHLGDHYEDARDLERSYPGLPIYAVRGNNDFEPDAPYFLVIQPAGLSIYLTHGHRERVRGGSAGQVALRASERGCTLALYGHTHQQHDAVEHGVRVMNPGSISLPRGGGPSCLCLTIQDGILRKAAFLDAAGAPYGG